jgi:cupin fold WbuC family metalloprotein
MVDLIDRWIAHSGEVLYPRWDTAAVTADDIAALKQRAAASPRGRCRICLHERASDTLHDMVIVLGRGAYDRPHRHFAKIETLVAMEGEAMYLRFAADGTPIACKRFSAGGDAGSVRVLRTSVGEFHGLLVASEWFVFCESTLGPFDPAASEFAPWSPAPENERAVERYLAELDSWAARSARP